MAAPMTTTKTCHMALLDLMTSNQGCCKNSGASMRFCSCLTQGWLMLLLLCVGTLFTSTVQAAALSTSAPIRHVRSAPMTPPTVVSLRPPNRSLRGSSAAGVRGAPTGAQPPMVRSLQPPSVTTTFRRGGLRRHDAPGSHNRDPASPIFTSSTRTHYRGGGLRSRTPAKEGHLFNSPATNPDLTRHYSAKETSAELPPSVISYRGGSRQPKLPKHESQVQQFDDTNQPIIDKSNNVIGIKMTSPEGKTTIEFMKPPVFDSKNNPIILDFTTLEEKIGLFDSLNETDYDYGSSIEGGIWDEEEEDDDSDIWRSNGNQGWSENVGGWSTGGRRGWEMDEDDIESTKRIDTYGHIIEEDLSHVRKGYSPRRNYHHNNYDDRNINPEHSEELLHRRVITPQVKIQENVNRKTLSITDIMRATNKTSDDLMEILKQKGIVFKDFLQLLKDGATLQHVKALLIPLSISTTTSAPNKEDDVFTTVLPLATDTIVENNSLFDDTSDYHFEFDTIGKENFDSEGKEEISSLAHSEIVHSDWEAGKNYEISNKRHNHQGKSRRKHTNKRKKKDKKKSKDSDSQIFNDPLPPTVILPIHSSVNDDREDSTGQIAPASASTPFSVVDTTSKLLESIEHFKTSTTISPEVIMGGPIAKSLTPPPANKISEATIIAISVEETLNLMSSKEKVGTAIQIEKNTETISSFEEKNEEFQWDKNHLEKDYVQDIYTKPVDHNWQLNQVEKDIQDYSTLGRTQDEHLAISQDAVEKQVFEYKFPVKGLLVISGILGALAVLTFVILISYTVIKCTKPPVVHNYQVNEQKSVT